MGKKFLFRRVFYGDRDKTAEELRYIAEFLDTETEIKDEFFWQAFNTEQREFLCKKLKFHRVERGNVKRLPIVNKSNPTLFILMSGHGKVILAEDPNAKPQVPKAAAPAAEATKAKATKAKAEPEEKKQEDGKQQWGMLKQMYTKTKEEAENDAPQQFKEDEHHMVKVVNHNNYSANFFCLYTNLMLIIHRLGQHSAISNSQWRSSICYCGNTKTIPQIAMQTMTCEEPLHARKSSITHRK